MSHCFSFSRNIIYEPSCNHSHIIIMLNSDDFFFFFTKSTNKFSLLDKVGFDYNYNISKNISVHSSGIEAMVVKRISSMR